MNWYIGQDIVAIKTHEAGIFKEGDVFTIKSLRESPCACKNIDIHIGIFSSAGIELCCTCGHSHKRDSNIGWFSEICFRPLDELADISELTEALKEPVFN